MYSCTIQYEIISYIFFLNKNILLLAPFGTPIIFTSKKKEYLSHNTNIE